MPIYLSLIVVFIIKRKEEGKMTLENTIKELGKYYGSASEVKDIIEKNAKIAGAAAVGGPIIAYTAALSVTVKMYTEICKCINTPLKATLIAELSKDIKMRLTAEMMLENIIIPIITMPFRPMASAYASVTLAGKKLLDILLVLAKQGKSGKKLRNVTNEELKEIIKNCELTDGEVKESVDMYKANREK